MSPAFVLTSSHCDGRSALMATLALESGADPALEELDAIESYFECITSCDLNDGICVEHCVVVHLRAEPDDDG